MRIVIDHNNNKMYIGGEEGHLDSGEEYTLKYTKQVEEVLEIVLEKLEVHYQAPIQLISIDEDTTRTVYEG